MIDLIRKLLSFFDRREKIKLLGISFLMLLGAAFEAMGLGLIVPFIGVMNDPALIQKKSPLKFIYDLFHLQSPSQFLLLMGCGLFAIYLFKNCFLALLYYIQNRFVFSKQVSLSSYLLQCYFKSPYVFHLQRNSAELLRNLTGEIGSLFIGILIPLMTLTTESIIVTVLVGMLFVVQPAVSFFSVFLFGALTFLFYKLIHKKIGAYGKDRQRYNQLMIQSVHQGLGGIKESIILGRTGFFLKVFRDNSTGYAIANRVYLTIIQFPRLFIETIIIGGMVFVVMIMLYMGYSFQALAPILGLFGMTSFRLMPSFNRILNSVSSLKFYSPSIKVIYHDLNTFKPGNKPTTFKKTIPNPYSLSFENKIDLQDIIFNYPETSIPTLNSLSLTIRKGESVAFVGSTGSGKTTLIDIILGLLKPASGKVQTDGRDISKNLFAWRSLIGYIPQVIYLCDDTIEKNIAFGLTENEIDSIKLKKSIKSAQLEDLIARLPDGLRTTVGERGVRLSGGERQRIGIARALYHNPPILIMDEATSSLDNKTEREVTKSISMLTGSKTLIIIAHRLSTVKNCHRIYIVKEGQIADSGSYEELVHQNADFKKLACLGH